jgi:hypothetical protein
MPGVDPLLTKAWQYHQIPHWFIKPVAQLKRSVLKLLVLA